jgi:hypothetical protein
MYYCPDIKQNLKSKMEDFEFFCAAHRSGEGKGGMSPLKPTFDPSLTDELINEANERKEQKKTVDSAIKASVAAAVTIVLVLVCVMADCLSRWKIRRRINKAMTVSSAAQAEQLIQKQEMDDEAAAIPKKV